MPKSRLGSVAAAGVLAAIVMAAPAPALARVVDDGALFPARVLAAHNAARAQAGMPRLQWDNQLGIAAARYAVQLAMTNSFRHSSARSRGAAGENLWMGTRGAFSVDAMIGGWTAERSAFRAGTFPAVSRTGNWHDVGHYTQMVWPGTQRVGCALATNARNHYLVCRYWPAGNVHGVAVRPAVEMAARR